MTPKELEEAVARAIAAADERNGGPPYEMRVANKHAKEQLFDEARAALAVVREAMQEPSDAMAVAGCRADDPLGELVDWRGENCTTREAVTDVFQAMLAASPLGEEAP